MASRCLIGPAANDDATSTPSTPPPPTLREKKKRGPKKRHRHGRPKLPAHLPRFEEVHAVPSALRTCPGCHAEAQRIGYKTAHKLNVVAAHYVVQCVKALLPETYAKRLAAAKLETRAAA